MSASLKEFTKRANEAETKLRALEAQLDRLSGASVAAQEEKSEWEVLYWPIRNRGNYVRLMFEEAGVPYKDSKDRDDIVSRIRSTRSGKQTREQGGTFQAMGPPLIRNGDFFLSQTIPIMGYLAEKFGLRPRSVENHAQAQMIASNCTDIQTELYKMQPMAKDEIFAYVNGRFQVWLDILENPLSTNKLEYYFDNKCTQADLAVFNLLDGVEELFGSDVFDQYVSQTHEYLANYYMRLKKRESIQRLMKKQEGIFSYHPDHGWKQAREILREEITFKSDGIIPDVVDSEPVDLLTMEYKTSKKELLTFDKMGKTLTPTQVKMPPYFMHFKSVDKNKLYTVILTDPDARDRVKHEFREWVHFVKINVSGADLTNSGDVVIEYVGSGPPQGTGLHRYVWLVYEQNNGKIEVAKCGQTHLKSFGGGGSGRPSWKARKFVSDNKLGALVAGTYYNAEYDSYVPKLYSWLQGKK